MNNGKLKQNIDKLERSLYDLSEIQVQITKKMKNQDPAQAATQMANQAQATQAQANQAQATQVAASNAPAKPAPAPQKQPTK